MDNLNNPGKQICLAQTAADKAAWIHTQRKKYPFTKSIGKYLAYQAANLH